MTELYWCQACHREYEATPGGKVKTHSSPGNGSAIAAPKCKGSLKLPENSNLVRCGECGQTVRKASGTALHAHGVYKDGVMESTCRSQAYELIKDELGAVEMHAAPAKPATSTDGSEAAPPTQTSTNATVPDVLPSSSTSMTSTAVNAPPSSADMFGDAGNAVRAKPRKRVPLEGEALALSDWFDDLHMRYEHSRPRSTQATIGPSEAGSECMRKIAMHLSRVPKVNFAKDSLAAWVGTNCHEGLEKMMRWANDQLGQPRFLVEQTVEFGSDVMPYGHCDMFDRKFGRVVDWKWPGRSSLSKMHLDGPGATYAAQLQIYAYGMERAGETVHDVALVALPREGGDLTGKYVYVAPYDRDVAIAAIKRVESIHRRLAELGWGEAWRQAPKSPNFLCGWCDHYLPGDKAETNGCSA